MATHFTLESSERDDGDFYVHLQVSGDGDLDHYVDAFKSFLIAVGYHPEVVADTIDEVMFEFAPDYKPRDSYFKPPEEQT